MPEEPEVINPIQVTDNTKPVVDAKPASTSVATPTPSISPISGPQQWGEASLSSTPMLEPADQPEMLMEHTDNTLSQVEAVPPMVASDMEDSSVSQVKPAFEPSASTYAPNPQFPTEPQVIGSGNATEPVAKKGKKNIVIGAIIAGAILLLGGGSSVLAYNVWYSNPEKVISDAIIGAITAKNPIYTGTLNVDSNGTKVKVTITTKQVDATGSFDAAIAITDSNNKTVNINGNALYDKAGDLYFKIGGIKDIVAQYSAYYGSSVSTAIDTFISKVENKWIKINSTDLKEYNASLADSQTCINKLKNDSTVLSQVTNVYKNNPFIVIEKELGQKDGSLGYKIKNDKTMTKSFVESFKETNIYKQFHDCDNSFTIDATEVADAIGNVGNVNDNGIEIWVNSWSHQITSLKLYDVKNKDKNFIEINPNYNQDIKIDTPTSSISLAQLKIEIDNLVKVINDNSSIHNSFGVDGTVTKTI